MVSSEADISQTPSPEALSGSDQQPDPRSPDPDSGDDRETDEPHRAISDISIELRAILGSTKMEVSNLLKLGRGAVIELDQKVKADVRLLAAGKLIAYGQVVVVEDNIAVKISRLVRSNTSFEDR